MYETSEFYVAAVTLVSMMCLPIPLLLLINYCMTCRWWRRRGMHNQKQYQTEMKPLSLWGEITDCSGMRRRIHIDTSECIIAAVILKVMNTSHRCLLLPVRSIMLIVAAVMLIVYMYQRRCYYWQQQSYIYVRPSVSVMKKEITHAGRYSMDAKQVINIP